MEMGLDISIGLHAVWCKMPKCIFSACIHKSLFVLVCMGIQIGSV